MADDDEFLGKIDEMFTRAVNILREDKILKHIKGTSGEPPAPDPSQPPAPVPGDVPPEPKPKHWWWGESDDK